MTCLHYGCICTLWYFGDLHTTQNCILNWYHVYCYEKHCTSLILIHIHKHIHSHHTIPTLLKALQDMIMAIHPNQTLNLFFVSIYNHIVFLVYGIHTKFILCVKTTGLLVFTSFSQFVFKNVVEPFTTFVHYDTHVPYIVQFIKVQSAIRILWRMVLHRKHKVGINLPTDGVWGSMDAISFSIYMYF